jgi:hypothetical protein
MSDNTTTHKPPFGIDDLMRLQMIGFNSFHEAYVAHLRASGWLVAAPDCVPLPRNKRDAECMIILAENYLKDAP